MSKKFAVLVVLSMVLGLASSAGAVWFDNFESYALNTAPIPSPWEADPIGFDGMKISQLGYGGSQGAVQMVPPQYWCVQWRATGSGETVSQVYGKVYADSGPASWSYGSLYLSDSKYTNVDPVWVEAVSYDSPSDLRMRIETDDYEGGVFQNYHIATVTGISFDTWYDIRMTISGNQALGEYKAASSPTWLTIGTVTLFDDFGDGYVGMRELYGTRLDDVGYVPEPATICLLGLGGLALLRRKS
jgi:hypothetical protein